MVRHDKGVAYRVKQRFMLKRGIMNGVVNSINVLAHKCDYFNFQMLSSVGISSSLSSSRRF